MKKKFGIILSSCLLMLAIVGGIYYFNIYNSVTEISVHASYVTYDSEKELSDAADIILYGYPIDKFEERKHVNKYMSDGSLYDFYTLTKFEVKKVIKNSTELTINKKDLFDVIEPVGFIQEADGKKIFEIDSYKAMKEKNNYLVFLKSNNKGGYGIINMSNGKFILDDKNNMKENDDKNLKLKNEVIKKYSNDLDN